MNQTQISGNTSNGVGGALVVLFNFVLQLWIHVDIPLAVANAEQTILGFLILWWLARERKQGIDIPVNGTEPPAAAKAT